MKKGKSPLKSKTFWANAVGIAAMIAQSQAGFAIGAEYQAGALAVVNLALRAVTDEPLDWGQLKGLPLVLFAVCALALLPAMQGCSGLSKKIEKHELAVELTVRAAAGRVLDNNPEWTRPAYDITADAIRMLSQDEVATLDGLEQFVVDRIEWDALSFEERDLLRLLIATARAEIEDYLVKKGVTDPGAELVRAVQVLTWINQAAEIRLPQAARGGDPAFTGRTATERALFSSATPISTASSTRPPRADANLGL